jgi:hypothetical protein
MLILCAIVPCRNGNMLLITAGLLYIDICAYCDRLHTRGALFLRARHFGCAVTDGPTTRAGLCDRRPGGVTMTMRDLANGSKRVF